METFKGIVQLKSALFVRPVSGNKVILAGVVPEWRKGHNRDDELWIAEIQITVLKKFKVPDEEYAGLRIDQIFCSAMNPTDFEELKK